MTGMALRMLSKEEPAPVANKAFGSKVHRSVQPPPGSCIEFGKPLSLWVSLCSGVPRHAASASPTLARVSRLYTRGAKWGNNGVPLARLPARSVCT